MKELICFNCQLFFSELSNLYKIVHNDISNMCVDGLVLLKTMCNRFLPTDRKQFVGRSRHVVLLYLILLLQLFAVDCGKPYNYHRVSGLLINIFID